ncbi:LLM class flavin-dependent oxidoreductase [Novosphingobium sp. MBES04]|uniref:LLM class flavin-dependent oxidoreductase n=1 Tax=Novosphingobium sp. MBES04 TaxID=1206458 RepID=UPI00057EFBE9|nr:LLM class flavin-dependent oxidoreductase [Novosphingobium sp. MBES04]GAM05253.1 F420-dependent methylene-tetrahydromethanopterin reductase [Novosphingobium sp. MBES04]
MYADIQDDLEIVGIVNHRPGSVASGPLGAEFDPAYIRKAALEQEAAGYDRVLIANAAVMPESFAIGAHLSGVTSKLGFMMAHRPGPVQPTYAARHLATLDRLSEGRAAVHVIAGADDREVQADGAFNTKEERYRIAAEYVEVMRRVWSSEQPFDFDGEFYTYRDAFAMVRPHGGAMPVYWGGTSDLALDLCGKVADVYAQGGDTFEGAGDLARKAHAAAARHGRDIKVLMTMVILLGETEDAAWERAMKLEQQVTERIAGGERGIVMGKHDKDEDKAAAGAFQRMLAQSKEGDRLDRCLWTGLNKAFKGRGNNSVLVGTPQQVADSLMEYRRLGITRFLLRSPEQDTDAALIGRQLVPELKAQMAAAKAALA